MRYYYYQILAPPFGPTVGCENNLPQDTTRGVGAKNHRALVASDPTLAFFLRKGSVIISEI